jgi:hypothetical protein
MNPCSKCTCPKPEDPCILCPTLQKEYAFYSQNSRLYNSALFGGIRLENPPVQTSGFYYDTGIITIIKPGIYLVTYIVNFPEASIADTTLALQFNGDEVTGTIQVIKKTTVGIPYTATAQSMIQVDKISSMRLSSSRILDITMPSNSTAASVTILEL